MIRIKVSYPLAATFVVLFAGYTSAQFPAGVTTNQLGSAMIAPNGGLGLDGQITATPGTAGSSSPGSGGFTLFTYGDPSGSGGNNLTITATGGSGGAPGTVKYWTSSSAADNVSGVAPDGFSLSTAVTWGIIRREPGAPNNDRIELQVANNTPGVYFALDNSGGAESLAVYNARLNDVLKFDATQFYKATGVPIVVGTDGDFSFTFSNFSGGQYRGIDLVFTPVPEPFGLFAVGLAGMYGMRVVRRRRFS